MMLLKAYRFLLRILRPNSGLTRLSFNSVTNYLFSFEKKLLAATLIDGTPMEIDKDDYHGRILWIFGTNDWKVSRTVNALLEPGDTLLDIGANYGSIGLIARHKVGSSGKVHLFEPQTYLAERLKSAISAARATNAIVHQVALFDSDGEMELALSHGHSGLATLVGTVKPSTPSDRVMVPIHQTESYVRALVSERSFGVKIDIEGAEPHVLPGLVSFDGLKFVVFEGDRNKRALFDIFAGHGFTVYGLCRTIFSPRVEQLRGSEDLERFHDFVAVRVAESTSLRRLRLGELARLMADFPGRKGKRMPTEAQLRTLGDK